jgi:hypothetical protein
MDGESAARAVEATALWRLGAVVNTEDKKVIVIYWKSSLGNELVMLSDRRSRRSMSCPKTYLSSELASCTIAAL